MPQGSKHRSPSHLRAMPRPLYTVWLLTCDADGAIYGVFRDADEAVTMAEKLEGGVTLEWRNVSAGNHQRAESRPLEETGTIYSVTSWDVR